MKIKAIKIKRPWYFFIIFLVTLPSNVLWCWPLVMVINRVFGKKLHWVDWGLWTEIKPGTWFAKKMEYSGVTFGAGGIAKSGKLGLEGVIDTLLEYHENKHVHQFQVMTLLTAVLAAYAYFFCGASYWIWAMVPVGGALAYLCAVTVAALRGERWYRDNIFERSAYAQTTLMSQDEKQSEIDRLARYLISNLSGEIIEGSAVETTRRLSQAPELGDDYGNLKARR
jgi:hypothetical protein